MDLLTPEAGTIFWMLLAAGIVFFALIKWGFPVITGMVDKRNEYIEKSLGAAKAANERLAGIQQECESILKETKAEQARIIKEATDRRDRIVTDAESKAREKAEKIVDDARVQIQAERDEALRGIRREVAEIAVKVAEKVILKDLTGQQDQMAMIDRMIDEVEAKQKK